MPFDSKRSFDRMSPDDEAEVLDRTDLDEEGKRGGIRCPLCRWVPARSSRWVCSEAGPPENYPDGCGAVWNTFDTRGKCPGCGHHWRWTACPACRKMSPHEDWYFEE